MPAFKANIRYRKLRGLTSVVDLDIYEAELEKVLEKISNESIELPKTAEDLDANAIKKIKSHAKRFGHSVEEVAEAVLSNLVTYRAIVGKNATRMGYYEQTLARYLEKLDVVKSVKILPKAGKNAVHAFKGELLVGGGKRQHIKSLDLEVEFLNGGKVYVIHKYTKERGGTQDGAIRDAIFTLGQGASENGKKRINLVACLDGPFYQKISKRTKMSLMDEVRREYPKAMVCTYESFKEVTQTIWGN
jgi:hypothetical protein